MEYSVLIILCRDLTIETTNFHSKINLMVLAKTEKEVGKTESLEGRKSIAQKATVMKLKE